MLLQAVRDKAQVKYAIADFTSKDPWFLVIDGIGWRFESAARKATSWPSFDAADAFRQRFANMNPLIGPTLCTVPVHDFNAP